MSLFDAGVKLLGSLLYNAELHYGPRNVAVHGKDYQLNTENLQCVRHCSKSMLLGMFLCIDIHPAVLFTERW